MKGLELSKLYYTKYGEPLLRESFKDILPYCCVGLVGQGSECFGFDDEYSQDHDFGPNFCIFLPEEIYQKYYSKLQKAYDDLPKEFMGYRIRQTPTYQNRTGVLPIERFYRQFTGCIGLPKSNTEWLRIPESFLAVCTNGEVFFDQYGLFTNIRNGLRNFYPEDVRRFKIASRCALMSQSGQYNYPRLLKREMFDASYLALNEFVKYTLSCIFLLNKQYMPFYKWSFKQSESLPLLQKDINHLRTLISLVDNKENANIKVDLIETICQDISIELKRQHLSNSDDAFLQSHINEILNGINDDTLKHRNVMEDIRL